MIGGELKRRLTTPLFAVIGNKVWHDKIEAGEPTFPRPSYEEVVNAILDEAAKEFPMKTEAIIAYETTDGSHYKLQDQRIKWFKKWFIGDEK
jgi:hypothetical protein